MNAERSQRIAVTSLRVIEPNSTAADIPEDVLNDTSLSLTTKGLYALLLAEQEPVNPFDRAIEDESEIAVAIDELTIAGLAIRVSPPR